MDGLLVEGCKGNPLGRCTVKNKYSFLGCQNREPIGLEVSAVHCCKCLLSDVEVLCCKHKTLLTSPNASSDVSTHLCISELLLAPCAALQCLVQVQAKH